MKRIAASVALVLATLVFPAATPAYAQSTAEGRHEMASRI
jgi:hypothetical protein